MKKDKFEKEIDKLIRKIKSMGWKEYTKLA